MNDWESELRNAYQTAAELSDDPTTQNGAVLVTQDGQSICAPNHHPTSLSLNASQLVAPHKYHYFIHAESAVIAKAAKLGLSTENSTLICPWAACTSCALQMITAGVIRLVRHKSLMEKTHQRWQETIKIADQMLESADIEIIEWDQPVFDAKVISFNGERWDPALCTIS